MDTQNDFELSSQEIAELKKLIKIGINSEFDPYFRDNPDDFYRLFSQSNDISKFKQCLSKLVSLTICDDNLETLPKSIKYLSNLHTLHIKCEKIDQLPNSIGWLKHLKTLNIVECHNLTTLPDSIGELNSLEILRIFNCKKLSSLPESIINLEQLVCFDLDDCEKLDKRSLQLAKQLEISSQNNFEEIYQKNLKLYKSKKIKTSKIKEKKTLSPKQKQAKKVLIQLKKETIVPLIKIKAKKAKNLPLSVSKFGGVPYWVPQMPYPVDSNGDKLVLLAQINCSELPPLPDFPTTGLLQFFIGSDDLWGLNLDEPLSQNGWRVVYHEKIDENISKEQVLSLGIPYTTQKTDDFCLPVVGEYELTFAAGQNSISPCNYDFDELFKQTANALKITFDEDDEVIDLIDEDTYDKLQQGTEGHHIGGYPFFTQDDPRYEFGEHQILLLQIDSKNGILWGDGGVGNFFITPQDLRKKDFSNVLYNWDCH